MTNQERKLISAESVTEGHPDKVCDQISDEILDELLRQDPQSHVAVETSAATGVFLVFGEVTSKGYVDVQSTVRETLRRIGYTSSEVGLDADSCGVIVAITGQSAEINQGVARLTGEKETEASREERYEAQGAGDQGVMFGYATDETDVLMPLPIYLAHRLAFRLTEVRKSGEVPHLRPDGKTQVTIEYDENDKPLRVDTVLISTQHDPEASREWLAAQLWREHVIDPVLDECSAIGVAKHDDYRQLVNPTGSFVLGGSGRRRHFFLPTYRKIIVDYVRRRRPPWRRRVQRQGPVQGRPFRRVRDPLGGEEHRRRGAGAPCRAAGRLRDWRGRTGVGQRRDVRHRNRRDPRADPAGRAQGVRPASRPIDELLDLKRPIYAKTGRAQDAVSHRQGPAAIPDRDHRFRNVLLTSAKRNWGICLYAYTEPPDTLKVAA